MSVTELVPGNLLSVSQTDERLSLNRDTVERLLHSGVLPGIRIGRTWRVPAGRLAQVLSGRSTGPTAPATEPAG